MNKSLLGVFDIGLAELKVGGHVRTDPSRDSPGKGLSTVTSRTFEVFSNENS